jgi:TM2 domain-containing membrane protein YozV
MQKKDRILVIVLAILGGWFGLHRFYLGQIGRGLLCLVFAWTLIPLFITLIDLIAFATITQLDFDVKYNPHLLGNQNYVNTYYGDRKYVSFPNHQTTGQPNFQTQSNFNQQTNTRDDGNENRKTMKDITAIRDEILAKIKESRFFDNSIVQDIRPLVDKYIDQVKELINRDEKLKTIIQRNPLSNLDQSILDCNNKMAKSTNQMLIKEYQNTLEKFEKHHKTIKEFSDQREMLALRLKSTVMSMEQIKFDLIESKVCKKMINVVNFQNYLKKSPWIYLLI